jgi:putative toxin-antitoxin system antitoxin component (TIGR02293 family)
MGHAMTTTTAAKRAAAARKLPSAKPARQLRVAAPGPSGTLRVFTVAGRRRRPVGREGFTAAYRAAPLERIDLIKRGVAAGTVVDLADAMGAASEAVIRSLGISRSTWARRRQQGAALEKEASERVVGLIALIGQVQDLVEEQGNPEGFDAAKWFYHWAEQPVPALGGRRPVELLDTKEGQQVVASLLASVRAGAYQ